MGSLFLSALSALSANTCFDGGRHGWTVTHCFVAAYQ